MTEVYKMMNGIEKVNKDLLFTIFHNLRAREHTIKLLGIRFEKKRKLFSFAI